MVANLQNGEKFDMKYFTAHGDYLAFSQPTSVLILHPTPTPPAERDKGRERPTTSQKR